MSEEKSDHNLFSHIKRCFLIAVPLSGALLARLLNRIPGLRLLNWRIPYLARPQVSPESLEHYNAAIKRAENLRLPRPRFSLFVGTDDHFVSNASEWALTKDDTYEGPIPGDHESVKRDVDVNSTLVKRIVQVVNEHIRQDSSTQRERIALESRMLSRQASHKNSVTKMIEPVGRRRRDVILLSCSSHKRTDRGEDHPRASGIWSVLADKEVEKLAVQTRVQIMSLIQQGRIEGTEFREGNRSARLENQELILGPDFGGAINKPRYLPAYLRYVGRSYQATEEEWQQFMQLGEDARPDVLIMSGLYGLLPMDEYIQNYDCHITDTDNDTGQTVRDYWGTIMTDVLISHLEWLETWWEIGRIVDLLSERSYQIAIDWQRIYPRWAVLHRVFEVKAGRDAIEDIGIYMRSVVRDAFLLGQVVPDQFYTHPDFHGGDRIAFESRLHESPLTVVRE